MMGGPVGADSVSSAVVPVFSYSSIEGFVGGALYNRYDYRGSIQPFRNYLQSSALVSTKGFIEIEARYEQTQTFGQRIRSIYDLFVRRYTTDIFFRTGNDSDFSKNQWDNDYYYFESVATGLSYKARYPLYMEGKSQLDLMGGAGVEYYIPYVSQDNSSFAQQMPTGRNGGWVNFLNTGLTWENRNSEFDPQTGNYAELEFRYSPDIISDFALGAARLELRQYFQLFNFLTVANRLEARHVTGDVPFWELSTLGGQNNLRGYPLNRFQGRSSLAYSLELRAWVLTFPELFGLKFGAQLFTDTGRVFTPSDDASDLFSDYKQTVGIGGAMSIFNPDFILRGEMGFSSEVSRIYIGVGYLF
jgi:outer membrane translocation and assembly module TamA